MISNVDVCLSSGREMGEHSQRVGVGPLEVVDHEHPGRCAALLHARSVARERTGSDAVAASASSRPTFVSGQNGGRRSALGTPCPRDGMSPCRSRAPVSSSTSAVLPIPDGPVIGDDASASLAEPGDQALERGELVVVSRREWTTSADDRRLGARASGDCSSIRRSRALSSRPELESGGVSEGGTGALDDPQRVGLPPRPIQRERRQRGHSLPQRERREVGCEQLIRQRRRRRLRRCRSAAASSAAPSNPCHRPTRLDDDRLVGHLGQRIGPQPDRLAAASAMSSSRDPLSPRGPRSASASIFARAIDEAVPG